MAWPHRAGRHFWLTLLTPSLRATPATTSAATGSSHQRPKSAFPIKPTRTAAARYAQGGSASPRRGSRPTQCVGELSLRVPENRHPDQARGDERHAEPARLCLLAGDQLVDCLCGHVRHEQEELNGDELLRALLRGMGEEPRPREAPDDDEARESLDGRVEAKRNQRDRAGENSRGDRYRTFGAHPHERHPREQPGSAGGTQPLFAARDGWSCESNAGQAHTDASCFAPTVASRSARPSCVLTAGFNRALIARLVRLEGRAAGAELLFPIRPLGTRKGRRRGALERRPRRPASWNTIIGADGAFSVA